eukprot:CAMPEP_0197863696 /NCGR_PEP_ID=MMETSP1438-20131217/41359_1 /TAXON_ID=1461541 /ORGANISM="Pterosperma sp., Strain CCMP1384" /LENGTH=655 /DNA_ID=CAMNT_0043481695 /DNA_START=110 /DNA_END=2077 /DNA_ORIENTATION=-
MTVNSMRALRVLNMASKVQTSVSTSLPSVGPNAQFIRAMSSSSFPKCDPKDMFTSNYLGLPRLPIPELESSVKRLLETVKPISHRSEYKEMVEQAEEFLAGPGPKLQEELKKIDASHTGYPYSYIQPHWDAMYLGLRCPGPIHMSPFFKLTDDPNPEKMDQTGRAAAFIHGFAKWTRKILASELEPDLDPKGNPLCSTAFGLMYSSAKVPKPGMDEWFQDQSSRVVTVVCKGNLCSIEVLTEDGKLLDVAGIKSQLDAIQDMSPAEHPVPVLSMGDRDVWADMRAKLVEAGNEDALTAVDSGLLCLCLDEKAPGDLSELGQSVLVGDGAQRWADKQQLIAYPDGRMAINFEHSYGDGMGWARFIHEVMCEMEPGKTKLPKGVGPLPALPLHSDAPPPVKHEFVLTDEVKAGIESAAAEHKAAQASVETQVLSFDHFGKDEIKTWKVSPDAAIQMAYQVAYYQLHSEMPTVYESCATRKFHHGRTETIRSVTPESTKLVKTYFGEEGEEVLASEMANLLRTACARHTQVSRDASNGLGCDRHLLSLKKLAEKNDPDNVPALFTNPLYAKSGTFLVSTSNATSTPFIDIFGFGPVSTDGYGCGYLVRGDGITVNCTHFTNTESKSSKAIADAIESTLLSFQTIVKEADAESSDSDDE